MVRGSVPYLLNLKSSGTYRCNVGFTEFDGVASNVQVTLYNVDGGLVSLLGRKSYSVPASQNLKINRIFEDMGLSGEYEAALAHVEVVSGGRVYAYASNVDGRTGDGDSIPAMKRQSRACVGWTRPRDRGFLSH